MDKLAAIDVEELLNVVYLGMRDALSGVSPVPLVIVGFAVAVVLSKLPMPNLLVRVVRTLLLSVAVATTSLAAWFALGEYGYGRYQTWAENGAGLAPGQSYGDVLRILQTRARVGAGMDGPVVRYRLEPAGLALVRPPSLHQAYLLEVRYEGGRLTGHRVVDAAELEREAAAANGSQPAP